MNKKHFISLGLIAVMSVALAGTASAEESDNDRGMRVESKIKKLVEIRSDIREMKRPELVGKITAISSSTITVTGKTFSRGSASTTFTVDASTAVIVKGRATTTVSALGIGDVILVQGTVTGTNIKAKLIHSGVRANDRDDDDADDRKDKSGIVSNGQPVIVGKVTAVASSSITVLAKASTTYTVDATNAVIRTKGNATSTISAITVGDNVVVQGSVNGSYIVATTIVDNNNKGSDDDRGERKGFFRNLGGFFKRFFGF